MRFLAILLFCLAVSACGSDPAPAGPSLQPTEETADSAQSAPTASPAPAPNQEEDDEAEETDEVEPPPPVNQLDWMDLPDDVDLIAFDSRILDFEYAGRTTPWRIFIAAQPEQHPRGLMYWTGLPPRTAMLFAWDGGPVHNSFWNDNVPIDLSVAFLDEDGRITEILHMDAFSRDTIRPDFPYWFALEVPRGRYGELGIAVGDRLLITDEIRALPR